MNQPLSGQVAIITGAASGLGEASSLALAAAGATTVCIDINRAQAEQVAAELRRQGYQAAALPTDVCKEEEVQASVDRVLSSYGRIDILVNNAAIDHTVAVDEMSIAQWDQVLAVNLRGPFLFCRAALPAMKSRQRGHIVNIASTAAKRAWGQAAAYHASKWGLVGFTRGLGVEGRPFNVKATIVVPGGMRTHFFDRFAGTDIPMPDTAKLQDPREVAELIAFIVTRPDSSVIQEAIMTPLLETSWP